MSKTFSGNMKLVDSSVWLALSLSEHAHHGTAAQWLSLEKQESSLLVCRSVQQSWLRLLTTGTIMQAYGLPPLKNQEAWSIFDGFLRDSRIAMASEPPHLDRAWRRFSSLKSPSPKIWMDAYLAAFAVSGNFQLVTIDRAFQSYPGLELELLV